ncbi:MAG: type II toxin-antitoxin system PemK/MazF family toxin [Rhizobiales bacterium]|uniref:type II toxin-antitoxin system PemK/MazF family toxin n=1 Tax=Xanthobacter flavus TaxID=281 RepID=UPI001AC5FE9A|nr:type II toxin-antitoxin system PemK/MazF family toxin [Xanthobacter flavus]MBN8915070.1 type II toxin-antitoxin system PemK/MazF family toxin [Hyphomicrobiales bacterium]MBP2148427.1 mRNA interferase MazF [Xanthobacter flavus]
MRRGDFVLTADVSSRGRLRTALIIQADLFALTGTVVVLLVTSALVEAPLLRVLVEPSVDNGLRVRSQVMIDKMLTVERSKVWPAFGRLEEDSMLSVTRSLTIFLGIA